MAQLKLYFDMDGTIADLYGTEKWLERLLAETSGLFENLKPLYELELLKEYIKNCDVEVITWTPKDTSEEYTQQVAREKELWLKKHFDFPIHALPYGTNKATVIDKMTANHVLVDDNQEVREMWKSCGGSVVDATKNIEEVLSLLSMAYL